MQARDDSSLDQSGRCEGDEKWSDFGYVLQSGPT